MKFSEAVFLPTGKIHSLSPAFIRHQNFTSSAALSFPLETQKSEENFDLALIASLEIDVVPYLGDSRVPDYLILQLGKMLHSGSQLQQPEDDPRVKPPEPKAPDVTKQKSHDSKKPSSNGNGTAVAEFGTTRSGKLVPRERFSYWCFDLLLLICSGVAKGAVDLSSKFSPSKYHQTGSHKGDGSLRYVSPCFLVGVDLR